MAQTCSRPDPFQAFSFLGFMRKPKAVRGSFFLYFLRFLVNLCSTRSFKTFPQFFFFKTSLFRFRVFKNLKTTSVSSPSSFLCVNPYMPCFLRVFLLCLMFFPRMSSPMFLCFAVITHVLLFCVLFFLLLVSISMLYVSPSHIPLLYFLLSFCSLPAFTGFFV